MVVLTIVFTSPGLALALLGNTFFSSTSIPFRQFPGVVLIAAAFTAVVVQVITMIGV